MHRKTTNLTSVQKYVEDITEWRNYRAKIVNGEMEVLVHGHWVDKKRI